MSREKNNLSIRDRLDIREFEDLERDPRDFLSPMEMVRSNIPEAVIHSNPDKHFCLVNLWDGEKQLSKNYENACDLGYLPYLRSEHPALTRAASIELFNDKDDMRSKFYISNDQILMWIPVEKYKKYLAYLQHLNEQQMQIQKNHSGNEFGGGLKTLIDHRGFGPQVY